MPRGTSILDTAFLQRRLWTPQLLKLSGWWDADNISTVTISTGVSQLRDASGNGLTASQGLSSSQPAYVNGVQNGQSAMLFDGAGDRLVISGAPTSARSLVAAVRPTVTGGGTGFRGITATLALSGSGSLLLSSNGSNKWGTWSSVDYSTSQQLEPGSSYVLAMDGLDSGSFFTNGAADGTYAATEGQTGHIGGNADQGFTGYIFEVMWIGEALPRRDRQAVEGYLSHKWAIPLAADHPFANRPPLIGD